MRKIKKTGFKITFEDGESRTEHLQPLVDNSPFFEEPRWGQLANLKEIIIEIEKALKKFNEKNFINKLKNKNPKLSKNNTITDRLIRRSIVTEKLSILKDHFEANRQFRYNNKTKNFDEITTFESNVKRYIYTEKGGWIDMHHFCYFAEKTVWQPGYDANIESYAGEMIQDYIKDNASGFSYEDLLSNRAGNDFGKIFFLKLWNNEITLTKAIKDYIVSLSPIEPENAPNYEYIPYAATNQNRVTKFDGKPLIGEELKNAAKNAHYNKEKMKDKNGMSLKEKIEIAHKKIYR